MAGVTCCYKCSVRHPNCHSTCDKYIQQKAQLAEDKKQERANRKPVIKKGDFLGDAGFRKHWRK